MARHAATLSELSHGRFTLGTGLGSDESGDFSRFGEIADIRGRADRYDEGLEVLRRVWSGVPFQHAGSNFHVDLSQGVPTPHPIPVWVASSTGHPNVIRRAARHDGIFPNFGDRTPTPDEIAATVNELHRFGLPPERPFDIAVAGNASPAWDEPPKSDRIEPRIKFRSEIPDASVISSGTGTGRVG